MLVDWRRCSRYSVRSVILVFTVIWGNKFFLLSTKIWENEENFYLVFPLKLRPHPAKICVGTAGRVYVVHDVDMNIVENDHIPIRG